MSRDSQNNDIFGWDKDGLGLRVKSDDSNLFHHEVLFEDSIAKIRDHKVFMGVALPRIRFYLAFAVVLLCAGGLVGRAFWMQIVDGGGYQAQAEQNRLRRETVQSKRGIIRDRQGVILAENMPSFDLQVVPWYLPDDQEGRDELLAKVGREAGLSLDDIYRTIESSPDPSQSITLKRDIPYRSAIALQILLGRDPALSVITGSKRRYPKATEVTSLSHVIGYVGSVSPDEYARLKPDYRQTDLIGKTGVESSYEKDLRGTPGSRVYEVDALNKVTSLMDDQGAIDGQDVTLSLDAELQKAAEEALKAQLEASKLTRGTVVVMDPRDGSLLAVVSLPAYDSSIFTGTVSSTLYSALVKDQDFPLLPRAWAGTYPSGSTVKPVIATAALEEGVITPRTTILSVGGIRIGQSFFPDWKPGGHGPVNVRTAIAWSVNTFFYHLGGGYQNFIGLGVDKLSAWMSRFGLGSRTGLDLPGEQPGFVPTRDWKEQTKHERWYIGDTYNLSIGQGDLLVTPLQVASFTATVAMGGMMYKPHVLLTDWTSTSSDRTKAVQVADAATVQTVRLGMRDTVAYGSGRALASFPLPVAGKTGTAQWRNDRPNHAWFTSFAPFDSPEVVVTVMIEEGGEGSAVAVPVARKVLEAWLARRQHLTAR